MSLVRRNRWFLLAGAVTLAFTTVSLATPRGPALTAIIDFSYLLITLIIAVTMLRHAWSAQTGARRFWVLMGFGYFLWASNQAGWVYFEVLRHQTVPDPWSLDIFLFLHLVPMIAAVGLRPHRAEGELKFRAGTLDFLLLMVWWIFLYAFVVFPSQYVSVNVAEYDRNFGALYLVESGVLILVLGGVARGAPRGWKEIYLNLMGAGASYAIASQAVNVAVTSGRYYSGCLYDVPLVGAVSWMAATILSVRECHPNHTIQHHAGKSHSLVPSTECYTTMPWNVGLRRMHQRAISTMPWGLRFSMRADYLRCQHRTKLGVRGGAAVQKQTLPGMIYCDTGRSAHRSCPDQAFWRKAARGEQKVSRVAETPHVCRAPAQGDGAGY